MAFKNTFHPLRNIRSICFLRRYFSDDVTPWVTRPGKACH